MPSRSVWMLCSRTDSDGYGAFSPPSPGTPVTPRLGSGVGPAAGQALGGSGQPPGGALPAPVLSLGGSTAFAGCYSGGLGRPAGALSTDGARPLQVCQCLHLPAQRQAAPASVPRCLPEACHCSLHPSRLGIPRLPVGLLVPLKHNRRHQSLAARFSLLMRFVLSAAAAVRLVPWRDPDHAAGAQLPWRVPSAPAATGAGAQRAAAFTSAQPSRFCRCLGSEA